MKAYPIYKECSDEWVKSIPSAWDLKWLKHHFNFEKGKEAQKYTKEYVAEKLGEYPVYSGQTEDGGILGSIDTYEYDSAPVIFVTTVGAKAMSSQLISGKYSLSQNCAIITPKGETKDVRFFYYLLQYIFPLEKSKISLIMQPSLRFSDLAQYRILYPPLSEQQAIADFLDRKTAQIDTLIEKKQQQIDLLREQHKSLINHAITKGLNPDVDMKDSGVEWLGEIPSHWEMTTVRYFYDVKLGKMLDSNKQNGNELVKPYLRAANIHWNNILLDEVGVNKMEFSESQLERYALQSGDLLVTEGGVTVGRSAIWNGELTECYFQNSLNRARPSKHASTKWLYYWMYFVTNNGFIDILADKSTFGHLTNEKLKALPIPIPPIEEHDEIISKLESYEPKMEAQISLIERQIEYLQEYRTALISEAVTGKIDVRTVHE